MAYSPSDLAPGLIREMLTGIVEEEQSIVDQIWRRIDRPTRLTGNINIRGTGATVAKGLNQGLAPLEAAQPYSYTNDFVQFVCKAYVGYGLLSDEERNDHDASFDEDAVAAELATAYRDANTSLDLAAMADLTSTALNTEFNVTSTGGGVWSDGGTASTLAADLRQVREVTAPNSDTIIIGRTGRNLMMEHEDFLATASATGNYYAGGTAAYQALRNWLQSVIGFTNVHFLEKLYDSAAVDADPSLAYIGADVIWIGHGEDLINVHPRSPINDAAEVVRDVDRRAHKIAVTRYDDTIRPTQLKGATLTNYTS